MESIFEHVPLFGQRLASHSPDVSSVPLARACAYLSTWGFQASLLPLPSDREYVPRPEVDNEE
jgi:hypothetical protein